MAMILEKLRTKNYIYGFFLLFVSIFTVASIIAIWQYMLVFGSVFLLSGTAILLTQGIVLPVVRERRLRMTPMATNILPDNEPVALLVCHDQLDEAEDQGFAPDSWEWKKAAVLELLNQRLQRQHGIDPELTDSRIVERVWKVSRADQQFRQCVVEYRSMLDSIKAPVR